MLFAVHISDGYLSPWWVSAGLALTIALGFIGSFRLRDEEIPRIGLVTAAIFIASAIHVKVGPTSVHLLLNGLAGVLLGWRVTLAIPIALLLQYVLFGHGGLLALGVNSCVMTLPALVSFGLFRILNGIAWNRHPWLRLSLVASTGMMWTFSLLFTVVLLCSPYSVEAPTVDWESFAWIATSAWSWIGALAIGILATVLEGRLETAPEFPLGLFLGELAVLMTLALNLLALLFGGESYFPLGPEILVLAHLPVALIEGVTVGFIVGFLSKVKPELLSMRRNFAGPERIL